MKWIYIIGGIAYFLYNLYRKHQKRALEKVENRNLEKEESSWGVNDLFSQFEEKYGVVTENGPLQSETLRTDVPSNDYSDYQEEVVVEEAPKNTIDTEENADHHAFDENHDEKTAFTEKDYSIKNLQPENEVDLKSMIVSSVILNRPEY